MPKQLNFPEPAQNAARAQVGAPFIPKTSRLWHLDEAGTGKADRLRKQENQKLKEGSLRQKGNGERRSG